MFQKSALNESKLSSYFVSENLMNNDFSKEFQGTNY